jgi:hypothetical protein
MPGANSSVRCDYCRPINQFTVKGDVCTCDENNRCNDINCLYGAPKRKSGRRRQWYVRSDGTDYKVGVWDQGRWRPGSLRDAFVELDKLGETDAKVVDRHGMIMRREDVGVWD